MSSYSDAVLSDNPLLYLRFDETSNPSCANSGSLGGVATCNGAVTRNAVAAHANLGVAVDLAGTTSDFISYPDNAALDITGDVTYEAWVNFDTFAGNQYIMSKGRDATNQGGYGILVLTDRTIQIRAGGLLVFGTSAGALPASGWHHVAFTRSGNTYTIYVDGISVGSGTSSQPIFASAVNMEIGRNSYESGTQFPLDGKVDEVAIYNTPLSAARLAAHYAAYNVISGSMSKIKFGSGLGITDEGSGVVRVDATSILNAQLASYTLALTDAGKIVSINNASANTLTVPTNSSVAFPIGASLLVRQAGAGITSIAGAGGVTVNSRGGALKLAGQYAYATLVKVATDTWNLYGDITT